MTQGPWKAIDNSPELLANATIPKLRIAYHVYYKDEIVGKVSADEFSRYPALKGQGMIGHSLLLGHFYFIKNITDSRGSSHATVRRAWEPDLLQMAETKINARLSLLLM